MNSSNLLRYLRFLLIMATLLAGNCATFLAACAQPVPRERWAIFRGNPTERLVNFSPADTLLPLTARAYLIRTGRPLIEPDQPILLRTGLTGLLWFVATAELPDAFYLELKAGPYLRQVYDVIVSRAGTGPAISYLTLSQANGLYLPKTYVPTWSEVASKPVLFSGSYADLTGKPVIPPGFSGNYQDLTNRPTLFSGNYSDLINRPVLSTVATSGNYADLAGRPVPFSGGYSDLTGKPILFSGNYSDLIGKPALSTVATSGAYADLTGKPVIAAAFSGSYSDLTNRPTTFTPTAHGHGPTEIALDATHRFVTDAQIAGWNSSTGSGFSGNYSDLLGKPTLSTVATTGAYADLIGKPVIPAAFSGSYPDLTNRPLLFSGAYADLSGKPILFSGSYTDLTNQPVIPPGFSGAYADLTGRPALFSGSYTDLTNQPALFSGAYANLTGKPVIPTVPTVVSAFTNDALYQNPVQVRQTVTDSLNANQVSFGPEFYQSNGQLRISTPASVSTVDQVVLAGSTNPVSGAAVKAVTDTKAATVHTHVYADVQNFNAGVQAYLQSLPGFAAGTVLQSNMTWVVAGTVSQTTLSAATLTVGTLTATTAVLNWTSVPNSTTYVVQQAIDAAFSNGLLTAYSGAALTTTVTGLQPATTYYFRIKATATGYADGAYSPTLSLTTPLPGLTAPTLSLASSTSSSIGVTLGSVSNAQRYTVDRSTVVDYSSAVTSSTYVTGITYTDVGLASSTTYYYRARASASGFSDSPYATASLATSSSVVGQLSTPVVTVGSATTSTLAASWGAITNATNYTINTATDAGFTAGLTTTTQSGLSLTLSGLLSATTYYVRVKAGGSGFPDSNFGTASGTTSSTAASTTALGSGTVALSGITSSQITPTWTALPNASGYSVQQATDNAMTTNLAIIYTGTALSFVKTGLSPGTAYYYRYKATGAGSYTDGAYSPVVTATTSATSASTTALVAQAVLLNGATTTSIATSWSLNPNASGYELQGATDAAFTQNVTTLYTGTDRYFQQTSLTSATTYYYRVRSLGTGSFSDGPYSAVKAITTATVVAGTYAVERTIKVNLSHSSNSLAVTGWNTIAPALASVAPGYVSPSLTTSDGTTTGVSFSVVAGSGIASGSGAVVNVFGGVANIPNAIWPAQVMQRAWKFSTPATFRISGLDPTKYYQVVALTAQGPTATQVNTFLTAGGVQSGVKYAPNNIGTSAGGDETVSPVLFTANNLVATGGQLDLVFSRTLSNFSIELQGFIILETNLPK